MTTQTQYGLVPANQLGLELTVTPVPDKQRIDLWSQYFGAILRRLLLKPHISARMDHFYEGYSGGIWPFYVLNNGGAFMSPKPDSDETWRLFNYLNGNDA